MFNYAQIDENGYCFGVSKLSGEVIAEDMIRLENTSLDYINKKFDRANKVWLNEYLGEIKIKKERDEKSGQ